MVQEKQAEKKNNRHAIKQADQLEIIYYTDPLCCWSWAIEPQLRRMLYEFSGKILLRSCMGGLLPTWKNYHDEVNSVTRPAQMGPVWMHAQQLSGMPMNTLLWMQDPPASSYPACIAVKSASLQSTAAGERYLRLLREALMLHGKNIAKENVLIEIANDLSEQPQYNFDIIRFKADLKNDNGLEAFRKDLQEVQYHGIQRFPTLVFKSVSQPGIILTGYRPYSAVIEALKHVTPHLHKSNQHIQQSDYKNFWQSLTSRELEEIINA